MATFKLVKSETVPLTLELAEKIKNLPASPTERTLDQKRVDFLEKKIESGEFIPPHWITANWRGQELRINGQHSSTALLKKPERFPAGLHVHRDIYDVDDEHGLVLLFRQIDPRQSARTTVDISGAYMKLNENLRMVDPALGLRAARAICWHSREVSGSPAPVGDEVGKVFDQPANHGYVLWLSKLEWKKAGELDSTPVMAAMFGTYDKDREVAMKFWDAVIYRRHQFDPEHPTTTIENYLSAVASKNGDLFPVGKRPKPGQVYESCAQAWAAYRAEKTLPMKHLLRVDPKGKGYTEIE